MVSKRIEKLKQEYTGQQVSVDARCPELARYAALPARVKTINHSGRALVEFEGADRGWYDLELDHLKVIDSRDADFKAETEKKQAKADSRSTEQPASKQAAAAKTAEPTEDLSRLELARMEKQAGGSAG